MLIQGKEVFDRLTNNRANLAGQYWRAPDGVTASVVACINGTAQLGQSPQACLETTFLGIERGKTRETYFIYETDPEGGTLMRGESLYVDACQVYTGPATALGSVNNTFQNCITNDHVTQCNIPSFIWSARSAGTTPVAFSHGWAYRGRTTTTGASSSQLSHGDTARHERSVRELIRVSNDISTRIKAVNDTFQSTNIEVELFSAEGDALHQFMDCIFMGPFARLDYGSRGGSTSSGTNRLPIPTWSRTDGDTIAPNRSFAVPCDADRSHGDTKAPFTCGSESRRAVIKYFVRDYAGVANVIAGNCDGGLELNISVQVLVFDAFNWPKP